MAAENGPAGAELIARMLGATIAKRVRQYRQDLGLSITQLAERAGMSKGMLSKIESVQTSPSLATLASLAAALEVPVTALFRGMEEEHDAIFVSAGRGIDIEHQAEDRPAGHRSQLLGTMRGPDRLLEPILVTLTKPTEVFPLYQHTGIEIIYMLEGRMEYGTGTARYLLGPGDALQFEGEVPHGPAGLLDLPVRFLSVKAFGTSNSDRAIPGSRPRSSR